MKTNALAHSVDPSEITEDKTTANATSSASTVVLGGRSYSTQSGLARLLGVTPRTLARWDERRIGPPKIKIGKLVLHDWLESHERAPNGGPRRPARRP